MTSPMRRVHQEVVSAAEHGWRPLLRGEPAGHRGGGSHWVTLGEPDEKVRTQRFALEIGAPVA